MMRKCASRLVSMLCLLGLSAGIGNAQVATGVYPYGTFDNLGFETVNAGNLNVHFSIPVLNKAGRGMPFYYNLSYDSTVWYPSSASGTTAWVPTQSFGWHADTEVATGYVSYGTDTTTISSGTGRLGNCTRTLYTNFVYHDTFGISHPFYNSSTV